MEMKELYYFIAIAEEKSISKAAERLSRQQLFIFIRTGEFHIVAAVAQSVERRIGSAEVTGPMPVSSFSFSSEPANFI